MSFRSLRSCKRGSLLDYPVVMIVSIALGFALILMLVLWSNLNTAIQQIPIFQQNPDAANVINTQATRMPRVYDGYFITLYVGLTLIAALGAYLLDTNPVLFVFGILVYIVFMGLSFVMTFVYEQIAQDATLSVAISSLVIIPYFLSNFWIFSLASGAIILLAFFIRRRD